MSLARDAVTKSKPRKVIVAGWCTPLISQLNFTFFSRAPWYSGLRRTKDLSEL